jgi:hypothetical protein
MPGQCGFTYVRQFTFLQAPMNWLKKLSPTRREASGLEWRLWRKLPVILLVGSALPLLGLGLVHLLADPQASAQQARWLQMADYVVVGVVVFHWAMVLTVGIGCVIVMVMKGPGYVADGYRVSHSDRPRAVAETDEEAAIARASAAPGSPETKERPE